MKHLLIIIIGYCGIILNVHAGNLSNGQWQPTGCGQKSPKPTFNTQDVDGYNKSVKEVMAWQNPGILQLPCQRSQYGQ
jgi:hypothetical protein